MQKPDGIFRGTCERSGEFNELVEIAKEKYERDQREKKGEINKKQDNVCETQESEIIYIDDNEDVKK